MASRNWVKIGRSFTDTQLYNLYAHFLDDMGGVISANEPKNLKKLTKILRDKESKEIYRVNTIGHDAVRRLVGMYYRSYPTCTLVKSYFRDHDWC